MRRNILASASLVVMMCAAAGAQTRPAPPRTPPARPLSLHRVFLDVNGGLQASSLRFNDTRVDDPFFGERASWTADYKVKNAPSFEAGGGVRVWRNLIAGVAVSRFEDKRAATLAGEIPHPFFFSRPRSISGESRTLKHTEQAAHVSVMWIVPATRRIQLAVYGGPSFFSVRREMIEDIKYADVYPYDAATYEGSVIRSVSQNRGGFHAGGDVAWFFTQNVGVGTGVRFARAQVRLKSPANSEAVSMDVGGVQAGAGLRLRLGSRR